MPNRIIKESIKKSPTIDQLSWFEEVVFYRIIVTADDYGRLDGRITVLKNELFPTKDNITKKSIEDALVKLVSTGLVCRYEANDIPFLYLPTWESHQQIRAKRSKFPEPDIICNQMISNVTVIQSESESESESESNSACARKDDDIFYGYLFSETLRGVTTDWLTYKKERRESYKPMGLKQLLSEINNKINTMGEDKIILAINASMAKNYRGIIWDLAEKQTTATSQNTWQQKQQRHPDYPQYTMEQWEKLPAIEKLMITSHNE